MLKKTIGNHLSIGLVTPYFAPHIGGVEMYVEHLAKELDNRGHDVCIYTTLVNDTKEKETIDGIPIYRIKPLFTVCRTPVIPGFNGTTKRLMINHDVIHAHSPPPIHAYYTARFCKIHKKPFIMTHHCDLEIPTPIGRFIVWLYENTFYRYTLNRADKIITSTRTYTATSKTIWKYMPTIIQLPCLHIVNEKNLFERKKIREMYGISDEDVVVLFVGRIVPHKGIEYLVRASRYTNAKFVIVGDGEAIGLMRKIACDMYPEKNKIIFTGRVSETELRNHYISADIFVLPSIGRLEAFGHVILEAMSYGKPVIISDIPGTREIITDGNEGFLIEPMNEKDIANKINILLHDEKLRKSMGENARKTVMKKYNWKNVIVKIEDIYYQVCGLYDKENT